MAEDTKTGGGLAGAVPISVVLAILASFFYTHNIPYKDERPPNKPILEQYQAAQDVDSRLWQDPFAAVEAANVAPETEKVSLVFSHNNQTLQLEATRPKTKQPSYGPEQIYFGNTFAKDSDITVIAVTLSGEPYQEAEEQRMRMRYAVLSGLANQGYTPIDEQHIGYFHPTGACGLQKQVAFEWWSGKTDDKKVLLLWVNESSLLGRPAEKLNDLLSQTIPKAKHKPISFSVIGPNTSSLLRDMVKEVKDPKQKTNLTVPGCTVKPRKHSQVSTFEEINSQHIAYYAAGATAPDAEVLKGVEDTCITQSSKGVEGSCITQYLSQHGVTLYRTTATDDQMMEVMAKELSLRQVKLPKFLPQNNEINRRDGQPKEQEDHIIILSEWDTFYGQTIHKAFQKASGIKDETYEKDKKLHVFGYMRGLDGILPEKGDKSGATVAEKKSDSKDKPEVAELIEMPEGQTQKDYLRRLADQIVALDDQIKDKGNVKGIAAIGVLGSDVHDKLMILEALRPHFPHKLFFTTDLNASYNHPAKRRVTHNLLVASAFGLVLRPELQGKIPPFRDTYQTATFFATQMLLKDREFAVEQRCQNQFNIATNLENEPDSAQTLGCIWQNNPFALYPSRDFPLRNCHFLLFFEFGRKPPIPLFVLDSLYPALDFPIETKGICFSNAKNYHPPRLFEIGRNSPIPLPTKNDAVIKGINDASEPKCSWERFSECKKVQPEISATLQIDWLTVVKKISVIALIIAFLLYAMSRWVRTRIWQFTVGSFLAFLHCFLIQPFFELQSSLSQLFLVFLWSVWIITILLSFDYQKLRDKAVQIATPLCLVFCICNCISLLLLSNNLHDMLLWSAWMIELLLLLVAFKNQSFLKENMQTIIFLYFVTVASIGLFLAIAALPRPKDLSSLWSLWMPFICTLEVVIILKIYDEHGEGEKDKQFNPPFYFGGGIGLILFFIYWGTNWWNGYILSKDSEPFYWLEGLSAWPSQLLRLSAILFVLVFLYWGHKRIQKMQDDLHLMKGEDVSFVLPDQVEALDFSDVWFIGNWKLDELSDLTITPRNLWKKYLGYCSSLCIKLPDWLSKFKGIFSYCKLNINKAKPFEWLLGPIKCCLQPIRFLLSGAFLRVAFHWFLFFIAAMLIMSQSDRPNVPVRGNEAHDIHIWILFLSVGLTIWLITWVVDNARLCERFIYHLSKKPSLWHTEAKNWAKNEKKVAPECVNEWLDVQLVVNMTKTMQPLIFGPVVCIALLVIARSPVIDDWDVPWGLALIFFIMLLYAISAEVLLQLGAMSARNKALDQLTEKISVQRNRNKPDEVVIKRIEAEIQRIKDLREGAFKAWYEWPLISSFGGLGTLWVALQYFAEFWGQGSL